MVKEKIQVNTWDKVVLWPGIIEKTAKAAQLSTEEKERLANSLAAEIITATAYISGCADPDRMAIAHLTTFIAAIRCPEIFGHRKGESIADRLLAGNYYPGGNPDAVKACMLLLELISLNDHRHDFQEDLVSRKVNPLAINLNYDEEWRRIEMSFRNLPGVIKINYQEFYRLTILNILW